VTAGIEPNGAAPAAGGPATAGSRRQAAALVAFYLACIVLSDAHFMADTADYARDVVAFQERGAADRLWEVSHLVWRPLGAALHAALGPVLSRVVEGGPRIEVTWLLVALNLALGVASVLAAHRIALRLSGRRRAAALVTGGFVLSHAFLNYAQAGTSYAAGLALLLVALDLALRAASAPAPRSLATAALSGLALAAAITLWLPYVLAAPGVLLATALLGSRAGAPRRTAALAAACGVGLALLGGLAVAQLGIRGPAEALAWARSSPSIGATQTSGAARAVFGLARSFVDMGEDGRLVKRFLLKDPYSPTGIGDLLRLSLWKLALVYGLFAATFAVLVRARAARVLAVTALGALPTLALGVAFDGGALERYLPLFPLALVALAASLARPPRGWPAALALSLALIGALNLRAMARPRLEERQQALAARIAPLLSTRTPDTQAFAVNWQDELVNFNRSFPFHPVNRDGADFVDALVTPGTVGAPRWRQAFAERALSIWERQGQVWISVRALAFRPRPEWNWVEGDDPSVSWREFPPFFARLQLGDRCCGDDGFVELPDSGRNRAALREALQEGPAASRTQGAVAAAR
jgi:hypothetical protein